VHRYKGVDGRWHHILARGVRVRDAAGRMLGWAGMNLDITRLMEAEQEIGRIAAESERQRRLYETVLTNTPDFVYVFSLDHRVVYANEALIKMWGRGRDGAIGKTFLEIGYEPWHAEMHDREIDQVRATRQPIRGEVPFNGTNGRRIYEYIFVPVIGADGEVEAVAGTTRDVTERKEAERRLREGQEQLDFALAAAELGQWSMNLADHTASRTLRHDLLFGYDTPLPEWTYERFLEHVVPDDRAAVDADFRRAVATGSAWVVECRIRRADGAVRHIWTKALVRRNSDGQVERMLGIVGDITDRRQAEESQAFLVRLADTLRPLSDPVDVQAAASRVLGEHLGANRVVYFEIRGDEYVVERDYTAGVRPLVGRYPVSSFGRAALDALVSGRTVVEADATAEPHRAPTEREAFAAIQVRGHVDVPLVKGGQLRAGMNVQASDRRVWTPHEVALIEETAERTWAAVERVRAEAALRQSEERLRMALSAARMVAWDYDPASGAVLTSDNAADVYGFAPGEEMRNLDRGLALLHPDDVDRHRKVVEWAVASGERFVSQFRIFRADNGAVQWMEERGHAVRDEAADIVRLVGVNMDITARKEAEIALRESEERSAFVRRSSGVGFWYCDLPFDVLQWDDLVKAHFHLPPDATVTIQTFYDRIHPDDREATRRAIERSVANRTAYNVDYRTVHPETGAVKWVRAIGRTFYSADGTPTRFDGVTLDVSEQKRAEASLRESEQRFRTFADTAPAMLWVTDPAGICTFLSRAWYEYTGQTEEEALGLGWTNTIHPADRNEAGRSFLAANAAREPHFAIEYRVRRADGQYRWAIDIGRPRFAPDGAFLGYVGNVIDVDQQKQTADELARHRAHLQQMVDERTAELEASHRKLRISERMAAMGTLSAGLGHDMGNLLVPVRVRLETLAKADLPETARKDVEAIQTSAEYLRRLAAGLRLLALDPNPAAAREVTELRSWWEEAEPMLRNVLPRGIALRSRVPDGQFRTAVSRAGITQAVFNLVQNAGDAMRERGSGTVTVWLESRGDTVLLGVTDDGPGMPPEVRTRCMEPFFTTKARNISTGLGLALVYGLIREAGGTIEIDSAPGSGTTFTLALPVAGNGLEGGTASQPPRVAVVGLREPRLQAFVTAELRSMSFTVEKDLSIEADLFVIDDLSKIPGHGNGRPIVFLGVAGSSNREDLIAIGEKPVLQIVRKTLRAAADRGSAK
ncbi:MAG: PAS domain S-box protein, partial [Phycisphaerales bacterium]|nr:PAS domain S-box protein [Phycisphaerales bacterium]